MERCADKSLDEPDEAELRALVDADATLTLLHEKHQRVVQKLDEKIAIAAQSYDIVDHHIRRLDQDLDAYATLLKQNGEFEEDKSAKKHKSKHSSSASASSSTGATSDRTQAAPAATVSSKSSKLQAAAANSSSSGHASSASGTTTGSSRKRSAAAAEIAVEIPAAPVRWLGRVLCLTRERV